MNIRSRFLLLLALLLPGMTATAQQVDYCKAYGDTANTTNTSNAIVKTNDGNLLFTAVRSSVISPTVTNTDILLVKTTMTGDTLWTRQIGTPDYAEIVQSIIQLPNNNFLLAGQKDKYPALSSTAFLISTDAQGMVLWEKAFTLQNHSQTWFNSMTLLTDGLAICGSVVDSATDDINAWLIRTNLNGDTLWTRQYGDMTINNNPTQIVPSPDKGFLMAGGIYNVITNTDAWLLKTDSLGTLQWTKTFGASNNKTEWIDDIVPAIHNGQTTGYVFTGYTNYNGIDTCGILFMKTDLAGNILWDKSITTGLYTNSGVGRSIRQLSSGGFYIASEEYVFAVGQALLMIKTDSAGNIINRLRYTKYTTQNSISAAAMCLDNADNAYVTGLHSLSTGKSVSFLARVINASSGISSIQAGHPATVQLFPNPASTDVTITSA